LAAGDGTPIAPSVVQEKAMVVSEIMSKEPFAVSAREPIGSVMKKLAEADVRHLPVVQGGTLVGIISDRDLRSFAPSALLELERSEEIQRMLAQPVSAVMSSDVVSVDPETEIADLIDIMLEQKVGAVPVVDTDSEQLLGIVSYMDVLRAARDSV
jgi:CBS domain-containing protein